MTMLLEVRNAFFEERYVRSKKRSKTERYETTIERRAAQLDALEVSSEGSGPLFSAPIGEI